MRRRISSRMRRRSRQRRCREWSDPRACSICAMCSRTPRSMRRGLPRPTRAARKAGSCSSRAPGDSQRDNAPAAFWKDAPYLTRDAAEWLLAPQPTAVAFDFPQDYPIRLLLDGHIAPTAEHVTHDVLLRAGITLIEYLVNTSALKDPRTFLCAAPLKIPGADGAPARVFAIEGLL